MPCHQTVDYKEKNWQQQLGRAARCAGSLIFLRNSFTLPRDAELRSARNTVEPDVTNVFQNRREFLEHHKGV
jgi:hypothetical protein